MKCVFGQRLGRPGWQEFSSTLNPPWRGREWLAEHLTAARDGSLTFIDSAGAVGVVHWKPGGK
jgi:hypothetical protein